MPGIVQGSTEFYFSHNCRTRMLIFFSFIGSVLTERVLFVGVMASMHNVIDVALGKAHGAIITASGEVFTFGVNNKGQCGRDASAATNSSAREGGQQTRREDPCLY